MLKKFTDYDQVNVNALNNATLPKGAYNMQIKGVQLMSGDKGQYLRVDMDICDGEYKNFFARKFENQSGERKNWGCSFFVSIPAEDGSKGDNFKKLLFKTFILNVEDSNQGFHWNWNENELEGKYVGGLFVLKEFRGSDGEIHTIVNIAGTCTLKRVADGTYKLPKDKLLPKERDNGFKDVDLMQEDIVLPFD